MSAQGFTRLLALATLALALASGTAYGAAYLRLRRAHRIVHFWSCDGHSVGPAGSGERRHARWFLPLMRLEAWIHTIRGRSDFCGDC